MTINVASIANAKVVFLYFHLETCQTVANSGTGLKQLSGIMYEGFLYGKAHVWS